MLRVLLAGLIFAASLPNNGEIQSVSLKGLVASQGTFSDRIIVEWKKPAEGDIEYAVMRSTKKSEGFTQIALIKELKYEDMAIERGVRYWYRVIPVNPADKKILTEGIDSSLFITDAEYNAAPDRDYEEKVSGNSASNIIETSKGTVKDLAKDTADAKDKAAINGNVENTSAKEKNGGITQISHTESYSGYTSIDDFKGLDLEALIKQKTAKLKVPADAKGRDKQQRALEYLNEHYMNGVKLRLFMTMSKQYFDRGEVLVVNGFDRFEIKNDNSQTLFYGKNYIASFDSKKLVSISAGLNEIEPGDKIIMNSDIFCIPAGKTFVQGVDGVTRLVHRFDGVGITTGYLKNDNEWRSRTVMLSTSRPDLKKKLKELSKPPEVD